MSARAKINQADIPVAQQHRFKWTDVLVQVLLIVWAAICLFPVYWMFTFSLKSNEEIFGANVMGLPQNWLWSNYSRALTVGNMGRYFMNSLLVTFVSIVFVLVAAIMATYAMTRLHWKGRKRMNSFFMLGLTIPIHAAIVPLYTTLSRMGLLNT